MAMAGLVSTAKEVKKDGKRIKDSEAFQK